MKNRFLSRIVSAITVIAVVVFVWTLGTALFFMPTGEVDSPWLAARAPAARAESTALPERLVIPSINVDAAVQQVGIKGDGSMATPSSFADVGWYKYGTIPGQVGSAVIAGHVDNALSLAGVFKKLEEVKIGDDIYIEQKDGSRIHFRVVDIQSFPYNEAPSELIFNRDDAARLNLITCSGDWLKKDQTYDTRLVIFTKLIPQ
ncbi:class F sortase [Candidatus Parcubacteria bacterium]|nr:MAG: class F sortase [Candidatus Parcubacteria bacterium]